MLIAGFASFDGKAGSCHQKEKAQQVARMMGGGAYVPSVHLLHSTRLLGGRSLDRCDSADIREVGSTCSLLKRAEVSAVGFVGGLHRAAGLPGHGRDLHLRRQGRHQVLLVAVLGGATGSDCAASPPWGGAGAYASTNEAVWGRSKTHKPP